METTIKIEESWRHQLSEEFAKEYMVNLRKFLVEQLAQKKVIFPHGKEIFAALDITSFDKTKVVIIGQDPYHGDGQAHGLCFSVKPGVRTPPSLINIYKEMKEDLGIVQPGHGYLQAWAQQGVLLLNSVLTVERGKAGSHQNKGWEIFTDKVIEVLNERKQNLVFILWGSPAQKKGAKIDSRKHLILKSVHPSPLSAHRGFFGNNHFSKTNEYLIKHGKEPINWQLPTLH